MPRDTTGSGKLIKNQNLEIDPRHANTLTPGLVPAALVLGLKYLRSDGPAILPDICFTSCRVEAQPLLQASRNDQQ